MSIKEEVQQLAEAEVDAGNFYTHEEAAARINAQLKELSNRSKI
ncbi:MAG: hypothetical protein V4773_12175 [Verrucomicrobiota bacterium]